MKEEEKQKILEKFQRVLVPLISKDENDPEFIAKVADIASKITLLLVIDTNAMQSQFGFAASEIAQGNELMEQVKGLLATLGKDADDVLEWGDTITKIDHTAKLKGADKIILKEQDNAAFKNLVKVLKKEKLPVEVI